MKKYLSDIWKNWRTTIKIIGGILLGVIFSALIVGIMMKIPKLPFIGGDEDGWMGFWGGILGSLFGVLGAYLVMVTQINVEKSLKEEENNPILILGKGDYVRLKNEYNNAIETICLPIINGGKTPVFNLKISYLITDEVSMRISDSNLFNDFIEYKDEYESTMVRRKREFQYISILMSGKSENIKLPYIINNVYWKYIESIKNDVTDEKDFDFKMKIILEYQDYKNRTITDEFYFKVMIIYMTDKEISCYANG
ncbi:hypothetical protein [Floricoccus penangensis]|uniref:hypothetical protein n=1 Tax=Floricoccus penangensis TaxID=1859475 RepID=UPI0020417701|nr:hypothetical protein [Floricoccus penangensis]URZ86806.1 hypothetical protein KIW23_06875 [Floricoccus penangensis]